MGNDGGSAMPHRYMEKMPHLKVDQPPKLITNEGKILLLRWQALKHIIEIYCLT